MYLHPQAQRYFYKLLCELADQDECQVIFSTHSPIFADVTRFEGIRLMRREPGAMSAVGAVTEADDVAFLSGRREAQKMLGFTATRSELFFARRVLLVEGPGDELATRRISEMLGHDIDAEDLAIVGCGGKSGIPFAARLCRALRIPFWVLRDDDIQEEPEGDHERAAKVRQQNAQWPGPGQTAARAETRLAAASMTIAPYQNGCRSKPPLALPKMPKPPATNATKVMLVMRNLAASFACSNDLSGPSPWKHRPMPALPLSADAPQPWSQPRAQQQPWNWKRRSRNRAWGRQQERSNQAAPRLFARPRGSLSICGRSGRRARPHLPRVRWDRPRRRSVR